MGNLIQDVRYAFRSCRKNPGFTMVSVVILALGIGANTAIFSFVKGLILTPLPYPEPERLVWVSGAWSQGDDEGISPPDFHDFRERSQSFEGLAAATNFSPLYTVTGSERPEQLRGRLASAGLFRTLGVTPVLASGLLFALQPVARAIRVDLSTALQGSGRTTTARERSLRDGLVVAQVALTAVLLVAATLLVQSLWKLRDLNPGFSTDNLLVTRIAVPASRYPDAVQRTAFWNDLISRVEVIPGVRSAAVVTELPLSGQANPTPFTAYRPGGDTLVVQVRSVTADYRSALRIPLLQGRWPRSSSALPSSASSRSPPWCWPPPGSTAY